MVNKISSRILIVSFPLPSPTNNALLANLTILLSHVCQEVYVLSGSFLSYGEYLKELVKFSDKDIKILDIRLRMKNLRKTGFLKWLFNYVLIHVKFLAGFLTLINSADIVIFFVGIPHMVHLFALSKLLGKKVIYY